MAGGAQFFRPSGRAAKTTGTDSSMATKIASSYVEPSLPTKAYGASGGVLGVGGKSLAPMDIEREAPTKDKLLIDILYCGVCHSDLHQARNDWKNTVYPCVPGHEIVGRVKEVGEGVTKFKVGDTVAVGTVIDSCGQCPSCKESLENYCEGPIGATQTYNGPFKPDGSNTWGGYSTQITVREHFVFHLPEALDPKTAGPILCAGATVWSPLRHWKIGAGHKVGVVGIGGLGHMAVKIAKALGAEVTAITRKEEKEDDIRALGADSIILSTDKKQMEAAELSLDFILITIPYPFDLNPYVKLLKRDGMICTVGLLLPYDGELNNQELLMHRRSVSGSVVAGMEETEELLQFCAEKGIAPEVKMIRIQDINDAHEHIEKEDVRFRYVIDMESLKEE